MTTTANPLLENCCNPCCQDSGCKSKWTINIQSTNPECLRVDTSECWVVKLEPTCPKVTYVWAWSNVTIKEVTPPDECFMDWGECCEGWWEVTALDEKVKACKGDTTPWYLNQKIEAWHWINISLNWCDWDTNSSLIVSVDEDKLSFKYPEIKVSWGSKLINLRPGGDDWHTLYLSDKEDETYNNMVCIGFTANYDFSVRIDRWGNSETPLFIWENGKNWSIYTGNHKMATKGWIKILADGYYRLFWQMTVQNNINDDFYFNLWRWLLRVNGTRTALNDNMYLSTAKHWAYAKQMLLVGWEDITVDGYGKISYAEGQWEGWQQPSNGYDWPWMTFNIDTLVDLRKWDVITLWYRPQSNNVIDTTGTFRIVWQADSSTTYNALFGWTLLWCYQLAPKCFQEWDWNEVYWTI